MAKTWQEQVKELDEKHGNPDYYEVMDFEVGEISLVDKPANRQEFVVVKEDADRDVPGKSIFGGVAELESEQLDELVGEVVETLETEKEADTARSLVRRIVEAVIPRLRAKNVEPAPTPAEKSAEGTADKEVNMEEIEQLKAQLATAEREIADLKARNVAAEKAARLAKVEARVEGYEREGKVIPAARDLLITALMGETVTVKSEDGTSQEISAQDSLARFLDVNKPVSFEEVTKAASQDDLGKFGGRTPDEISDEALKLAGRKPA